MRKVFLNLRISAKRRDIKFELTFEEFKNFIRYKRYMKKRGRGPEDLTIDRIDESQGYKIGNIQILKKSDNVKKFWAYHRERNPQQVEEAPF